MMKKLFILVFLALLCTSLSAFNIFDGKVIFTSHDTAKDSLGYLCIEKAGGVIDTFAIIDTLGNITFFINVEADTFVGATWAFSPAGTTKVTPTKVETDTVVATVVEVSGDGTISGQLTSCIEEIIKASTGNITAVECESTLVNNYGQGAANTQTLPTATEGLNCQVVTITIGNAFHLDCQGTDKFYLDGVALNDGDKISNAVPAVGDAISIIAVQTGASEWNWIARTLQGTWADGG